MVHTRGHSPGSSALGGEADRDVGETMSKVTWPNNLTAEERAAAAGEKLKKVVGNVMELIAYNEANRIIVYSPALSAQIPRSHAAHAFNLFQTASHRQELIWLCALWDKPAANRLSLPTIRVLVDDPSVRARLRGHIVGHWPDDARFGNNQADRLLGWMDRALPIVAHIETSQRLRELQNFRDKHLAHSLSETYAEAKGVVFKLPKYGFERALLRLSMTLTRRLYLAVCGTDFDFMNSRRISRRRAEALWQRCRFEITD